MPLLVAISFTAMPKQAKVVEVDFSLVQDRPKVLSAPEVREKPAARMTQPLKNAVAPEKSLKPGRPLQESREAVPAKKAADPPPEPILVTASDEHGETVVGGVEATYTDASGLDSTLQSHGGTAGGTKGGSEEGGDRTGRGQEPNPGAGALLPGSKDYAYIRDEVMKNIKYPERARRSGFEGKTIVSFVVLESGATSEIKVVKGSGYGLLDESAKEGVAKTLISKKVPYRVLVVLPVVYRLRLSGGDPDEL